MLLVADLAKVVKQSLDLILNLVSIQLTAIHIDRKFSTKTVISIQNGKLEITNDFSDFTLKISIFSYNINSVKLFIHNLAPERIELGK